MQQFPGQQYLNDPMANMAMQYGQNLAGQGTKMLNENVIMYHFIQNDTDFLYRSSSSMITLLYILFHHF